MRKVNDLIKEISREPFIGIGKPEMLKHAYAGYWSRRITDEHRLIYRVAGVEGGQMLVIAACRFHY